MPRASGAWQMMEVRSNKFSNVRECAGTWILVSMMSARFHVGNCMRRNHPRKIPTDTIRMLRTEGPAEGAGEGHAVFTILTLKQYA